MLVTLAEYAEKYGKSKDMVYAKYRSGLLKTAKKYGHTILVDDLEPLPLYRVQSGDVFENGVEVVKLREKRTNRR